MSLAQWLSHLLLVCAVIAVVIAAIRKDAPRAIALVSLKFFLMTLAVMAGIKAVLQILIWVGSS